jgi:arylsulfatase A-like enzyme
VTTDDTVEYLAEVDEPFFCWTHYMDVHHPCFPPEPYRERHDAGDITQAEISEYYSTALEDPTDLDDRATRALDQLYDAAIDYVDDQIARILDTLHQRCLYEDTLVILTSDHGELFGEYEMYGKPERMYDELLHVPLIVANGPSYLERATDDLVSLLDIPPLIHDTLGLEIPEEYEGRRPGVDEPREFVLAEHEVEGEVIVGARSKDWLYEGDKIRDEHRLFDLRDGGFERADIEEYAEESQIVRAAVKGRLERLDVETRRLEDEVEGDVQSRLEDLGYM